MPVKNDARTFSLAAAPALWIRCRSAGVGTTHGQQKGGQMIKINFDATSKMRWAKCGKQYLLVARGKKITRAKWSIKCLAELS